METLSQIIKNLVAGGARPITVTMRTIPKLAGGKKVVALLGNPHKVSVVNGMINFDYERSVNRQLGREDKAQAFKVQSAWFNHTDTPAIVCHKNDPNKLYLQMKVERALDAQYFDESGKNITDAVKPYLPKRHKPTHQGVEKFVHVIEVAFDNITSLVCDGKTYWIGGALGEFLTKDSFPNGRIVAKMFEDDSNSTYCEKCGCRITIGKCKHGVRAVQDRELIEAFEKMPRFVTSCGG